MRRTWLSMLGWAILVAGLSRVLLDYEPETIPVEAERSLYYALGEEDSVLLRLQAGDEHLRIRAHLEAGEVTVDEDQTWLFGVKLELAPFGGEASTHTYWMRSRSSLLENGEASVIGPRPERWVTDARSLTLELPEMAARGGHLRILPVLPAGPDLRLLLRVERQTQADTTQMMRQLDSGKLMSSRAGRILPLPWTSLEDSERQTLAATEFEPLAAERMRGSTVAVHRLGPVSPTPRPSSLGTRLEAGEATSLTLQGPCTLTVASESLSGARRTLVPEVLQLSPQEEARNPYREAVPQVVTPSGPDIVVPLGALWVLTWTNPWGEEPLRLQFQADPLASCAWGEPPVASGGQGLSPETRRLTAWRLPEGESLSVPVATGDDLGQLVIESRPHPPADWSPDVEASPITIHYEMMDQEEVVSHGDFQATFSHSPLEHGIEPERGLLSHLSRTRLIHPHGASSIRFEADGGVDMRFLVPLDIEAERAPRYGLPPEWRVQNAPWELAPYVSLAPEGADILVADQRMVRFDATVRPIAETPRTPPGSRHTHTLHPRSPPPSSLLAEASRRRGGPWRRWYRTLLDGNTALEIPEDGRVSVDFRVAPFFAGKAVSLHCGETEASTRLPAAAATLHFDGLPPGEQDCAITGPNGRYLAHVPGSGRRWQNRRVYRAEGRTLQVPVQVPTGGTTLYIRSYTSGQASPLLRANIDNGRPQRRYGVVEHLSPGSRTLRPRSRGVRAYLLDDEDGRLVAREAMRVILGDDLRPGLHTVSIQVPSNAGEVYLRFDAGSAPRPEPSEAALWRREDGS